MSVIGPVQSRYREAENDLTVTQVIKDVTEAFSLPSQTKILPTPLV